MLVGKPAESEVQGGDKDGLSHVLSNGRENMAHGLDVVVDVVDLQTALT